MFYPFLNYKTLSFPLLLVLLCFSPMAHSKQTEIEIPDHALLNTNYSIGEIDSIYLNLGEFYRNLGNFNSSTKCFYEGLSWSEDRGLDSLKARYLTNIGINNSRLKNFQKSKDLYNQALAIYTNLNDTLRQSFLLNNLSLIYRNQKQFDQNVRQCVVPAPNRRR